MDPQVPRGGRFLERQRRRVTRRKQEILAAAALIFAQKGYANATTREIADAADVAEGTIYNYFGGKRELLLAIAGEAETPLEAALREAGQLESRAAMVTLFEKALDISEARLPFIRTLFSEAWVDDDILAEFGGAWLSRIAQAIERFIADRVASGAFRPVDPPIAARMVIGMFAGLVLPMLRGVEPLPSPPQRRALAEAIVDVLLDGIRARTV